MPVIGDDPLIGGLARALDGLAARQRAIAENVANIQTPNYRAKTVSFESSLKAALQSGNPADLRQVQITTADSTNPARLDGNNVLIDQETTALEETALRYQLMTQAVTDRFKLLRTVMRRDS
jgi:flagellar basal-body rod protein FlgB